MKAFWSAILLLCFACSVRGLDDTNWNPLVTLTFPLDNKGKEVFGHTAIVYILYPSGLAENYRDVFGGPEQGRINTAGLNQAHVDEVLRLETKIAAQKSTPRSQTDAILIQGTATHENIVARDIAANRDDIRQMLRLMGGVRGDLEKHLLRTTAPASETSRPAGQEQRKEYWIKTGYLGEETWKILESENANLSSETHRLIEGDLSVFQTVCENVAHHRFDGEKAEFQTLLLVYFDCKRGDEAFLRELRLQSAHTRKEVARDLLQPSTIPSASSTAAPCPRQLRDGLKAMMP